MRSLLIRYVLLLGTLLALLTACGAPYRYNGSTFDQPKNVADWTINDQHGQPFQLSAQRGNVTLLYFGFTNCPNYCPTTMGDWKQIKQQLGEQAARVRFVMLSVDPANDTPAALQRYLAAFDPSFIGLRPSPEQLDAISREYGVGVDVNARGGEHAAHREHDPNMHGTFTYAIDPDGKLRVFYPYGTAPDKITADIREMLRG